MPGTSGTAQTTVALYERPFMPLGFDLVISAVFAPFGGVRKLRSRAVDLMNVGPGCRVLELACGTGGITRLLVERGAQVACIDGSNQMLARAKRRAPNAHFQQQQLESLSITDRYDRVLLAFVLHELPRELRAKALSSAVAALAPCGVLAVLDHAVPRSGWLAKAWRKFLLRLESSTVIECIEEGYDSQIKAAGARVFAHHDLAGGTALLTLARGMSD